MNAKAKTFDSRMEASRFIEPSEAGGSFEPPALASSQVRHENSLATMAGRLHRLKDPVQVIGLRRLHRRELLV